MPFDPTTLLMIAAMIALFYFMIIRPGQKRAKQQQEMTSSLQPGALIMTTAGVYGRVVHVGVACDRPEPEPLVPSHRGIAAQPGEDRMRVPGVERTVEQQGREVGDGGGGDVHARQPGTRPPAP